MVNTRPSSPSMADPIIIGAGPIGATLALALAKNGIPVTLLDKGCHQDILQDDFDRRAYALSLGTITFFKELGVWDAMKPHAQPIQNIWVVAEKTNSPLVFDHADLSPAPMGYIIESQWVLRALYDHMTRTPQITWQQKTTVAQITQDAHTATVHLERQLDTPAEGTTAMPLQTPLIIAADGRFSALAKDTSIPIKRWSYDQYAVVCPLAHTIPHEGWAFELFTTHGPFAILPMVDRPADHKAEGVQHMSSLVWSVPKVYAEFLLSQTPQAFERILKNRFGNSLGTLSLAGARRSYPLSGIIMKQFYEGRIAFAGDAICGIHPVAGQGLNLGIQGVGTLAQIIIDAYQLGLDPGREEVLQQYHRGHRGVARIMAAGSHSIVKMFEHPSPLIRRLMGKGLGMVNQAPFFKRHLMRYAMGIHHTRPAVMGKSPL